MTKTETRKWTVRVIMDKTDVTDLMVHRTRMDGSDTIAATAGAGLGLARELIAAGLGGEAEVILFKQLKGDDAPIRDRSYCVWQDRPTRQFSDGIRHQYTGA